jgi:predicted TPR repeat methyltransferase
MPQKRRLPEAYDITSAADAKRLYGAWANYYDQELVEENRYTGPELAAAVLARELADREARIIDIGCGTGLVGERLRAHGFSTIDGLDLVPEMLAVAAEKGAYRELIEADLLQGAPLPDASYTAAISVGTFTHNHVGPSGLDEVLRLVQPGGLFVVMINVEAYASDGYEAKFGALVKAGHCRIRTVEEGILFQSTGLVGRIMVLDVR